jgi:division protein CdvB (Snf7/Vps24/ESCRT-III family)
MDDEVFEKAKEEDMDKDEAEELQDIVDETGLDVDDAYELWEAQ